jgi:hypothetical protein
MKEKTVRIKKATIENIYFDCPECKTENVVNRASELQTRMPVSGRHFVCQNENCKAPLWVNSDRTSQADYMLFLTELYELKAQKRYRDYILTLCQGAEIFFVESLINYKLDRNPLFRNEFGGINLPLYNYVRNELNTAWKGGGFVLLRNAFREEFKDFKPELKTKGDSQALWNAAMKEVSRSKINEIRNAVVHSTAYLPTLAEVESFDELETAIWRLGHFLNVTESVYLLNKNLGRPKLEDMDPQKVKLAKKLFNERKKNNLSVDDICQLLGVGRTTLYRYVGENEKFKFFPYLSTEIAFLSFMEDFNDFRAKHPNKVYLRSGQKDPTSSLRPRETLGTVIMANVAKFLSGDTWVPGWIVDEDGKPLPENIAHDGAIRSISGKRKGKFMRFEQVMATEVAADATPNSIEDAIIREATRKSAKGDDYVGENALVILADYVGQLSDLQKLAKDVSNSKFQAIYLLCMASPDFKDFICVILKNPADTLGPISVKFNRPDGVADVDRLR